MIKISTVAAIAVTAVAVLYSVPNIKNIMSIQEKREQISKNQKDVSEQLASIDNDLNQYKEKYKDISIMSNLDLAKTVASLKGSTFCSATSIAEVEGRLVDCAEVTSVEDTSFFSPLTVQIRFKLAMQNLDEFLRSIGSSVISAECVGIDTSSKTIFITANSAFSEIEMEAVNE